MVRKLIITVLAVTSLLALAGSASADGIIPEPRPFHVVDTSCASS